MRVDGRRSTESQEGARRDDGWHIPQGRGQHLLSSLALSSCEFIWTKFGANMPDAPCASRGRGRNRERGVRPLMARHSGVDADCNVCEMVEEEPSKIAGPVCNHVVVIALFSDLNHNKSSDF
jgi:hypothetical protein